MLSPPEPQPTTGLKLFAPIVVLACGHMLSNMVRTLPAVSIDLIAADFHADPAAIGSLAGAYHFAFAASQIPLGVALDRFSVRTVSLSLLIATMLGATFAAFTQTPLAFCIAQILLGIATSGMLLCPVTYAARRLPAAKFGMWTGIILSLGNCGMILSASPLAWLVDRTGWRGGFVVAAGMAIVIALMVSVVVKRDHTDAAPRRVLDEALGVFRLGFSRPLRGVIVLAFFSLAITLVLRGVWGGPWLMNVKGQSRFDAGQVLLAFTLSMIVGPLLIGVIDRRLGQRRALVIVCHTLAALALVAMACGGPGGLLSNAFGVPTLSPATDGALLVAIGFFSSAQPLLYAITRQVVPSEDTGKALSAVNLSFFFGTAMMQATTGIVAARVSLPAALQVLAFGLLLGVAVFAWLTRPARTRTDG
ncbi:MFS transporter [Bradyrhizobium sp. U87765 SZCCT0131]|uniref:MFS transporter n=1 Tax=unclassified Bradyrhizobium TaxID=2631580 RepID=UPI001BA6256E|nr:MULTISPECIES: MFS transporter [unclassified Bradyrhizobium]MBR1218909.1 MFS transporter [Bradyrhizobium sp. U87765 SZCCT0131]MBR1261560.1 MFS transporter [Bradyrhizobium sp. U87765 SZCCT0134]MBR1306587.1 MFS transporter [Bradyrhizobium sp. U87765 SZCCT0110]MBR1317342.1 MFS transporter [Bradyrhizobium sp. U87765 SZCCT0109]MBR1351044.1 MFS transporter [Bradyrhizobium sp. U87765 SZCCT0048]